MRPSILALLVLLSVGCRAADPPTASLPAGEALRDDPPRALEVVWRGGPDGQGGGDGPVVVMLHGYGAPADDLVGLSSILAGGNTELRFAFPAGPIDAMSGRAWWALDAAAVARRPADRGRERPAGLALARRDLLAWLEAEREAGRVDPARTVLAGFSQGAMLATDVALRWEASGLMALSGSPVAEDEWLRLARGRRDLPVLMSHGRGDRLLAFSAAERLSVSLADAGLAVRFVPFDGGHEIPAEVIRAMTEFLPAIGLPPRPARHP